MSNKIYSMKQFYRNFFNFKIFRDYRHQPPTSKYMSAVKDNKHLTRYDPNADYRNEFLNWLIKRYAEPSKLYYELTHFKDIGEFREQNQAFKCGDRLLFDFDNSTEQLKSLKQSVKDILDNNKDLTQKQLARLIKPIQKEYRDTILNTDVLEKSYNDCKKLVEYFNRSNIPVFTEFSGAKGFHAYVFFNPIQNTIINVGHDESVLKNTVHKFGNDLINKLQLETFDPAPFNNIISGMGRVPYSKHEFTALQVLPCDMSEPLEDILNKAKEYKPKPQPFNFNEYSSNAFRSFLLKLCTLEKTKLLTEQQEHQTSTINNNHLNKVGATGFKTDVNNPFTDMRVLCRFLIPHLYQSHHTNYDLYYCPFHEYDHPSALVTKGRFNCQSNSCTDEVIKEFGGNGKLKPKQFIKKFYHLDTDAEVKAKQIEIKNQYIKWLKTNQKH